MLPSLDIRRLRCWDGLHYSFQVLHLSQESLWPACCEIPTKNEKAIEAISICWTFIDALHRVREIAQSTPGLNGKHLEMRVFLEATLLAEEYRHYIQHLRGEIAKEPPNKFALWGSLAWADPLDPALSHMAHLGAQISGDSVSGCVWDIQNRRWASKVCLGIGTRSFNFDIMHDAASRFEKFVVPEMLKAMPADVKQHDVLPISSFKIALVPIDKSLEGTREEESGKLLLP
jgi:hypothetical protein